MLGMFKYEMFMYLDVQVFLCCACLALRESKSSQDKFESWCESMCGAALQ